MMSSPPNYFRRYHNTESQTKPSNQSNLTCPTQESDWMNDQDIRYKKNVNVQFQYPVPTFNRFNIFNQKNC